jgi:hypothetical protein
MPSGESSDDAIRKGDPLYPRAPVVPPRTSQHEALAEGEPPRTPPLAATTTMRVRATGSGRIVGWSELQEGRLVDASRFGRFFFTTTLTNVITDLCALAESLDSDYQLVTLVPNGPTTASLDLKLVGSGFEIICARRLVRGWFPLNPFAAEFGSNYDVVVTVGGDCVGAKAAIVEFLRSKYPCEE